MKKCIITGNVGQDPENRADKSGNQYVTFSVGVSVGNKQKPKTDWVNVSCTGKLAEIVLSYVKKGSKVLVEGFPSINAYISKQTHEAVGTLVIYANNVEFLNSRESAQHDNSDTYTLPDVPNQFAEGALTSDNIPF